MPGFDGTGPMGMGLMTGRGRGYCLSYIGEGTYPGMWLGRGGGRGRRNRHYATGMPRWARRTPGTFAPGSMYVPPEGGQREINFLKEQVNNLEGALKQARKRIDELENKD